LRRNARPDMPSWVKAVFLATAIAAAGAHAQSVRTTTEAQALYYIQGAFNTDAAHAILSENVSISRELRERLALAPNVDSRRIYDTLTALTKDKSVNVRKASAAEVAGYPGRDLNDPLYVVESGDLKIIVQYNLQRDNIHFLAEYRRPAPDAPKPVDVARVESPSSTGATGTVVNLAPILFDFNKATIGSQAKAKLESEGFPKLMERSEARYVISGHADVIGAAEYNQALSEKRAEAVRSYVVSNGVDASKIQIVAFGETMPVKTCAVVKDRREQIACLAPNRRVTVEIKLSPP